MDETEVGRIASWVGLDVGKQDHHATVVSAAGERLFERAVGNDEAAIERLLDRALESGPCALVIDQPGSIGSLAVCVARRRGVPVAYVETVRASVCEAEATGFVCQSGSRSPKWILRPRRAAVQL